MKESLRHSHTGDKETGWKAVAIFQKRTNKGQYQGCSGGDGKKDKDSRHIRIQYKMEIYRGAGGTRKYVVILQRSKKLPGGISRCHLQTTRHP